MDEAEKPLSGLQDNHAETGNDSIKKIEQMDSFEKIEAEIMASAGKERKSSTLASFVEDYSIREETTLDDELDNPRSLRKQPKLDELDVLDLEWRLAQQNTKSSEDDEKALERLEVAALIKKAEQKLLPEEQEDSSTLAQGKLEVAKEELVPEFSKLDKIISAAELIRMESSDQSEEEGFRLRLSCIFEESESDSGSGSFARTSKLIDPSKVAVGGIDKESVSRVTQQELQLRECADAKVEKEIETNSLPQEKDLEISEVNNVLEDVQVISEVVKQTSDHREQCNSTDLLEKCQNTSDGFKTPVNVDDATLEVISGPESQLTEENVQKFDEEHYGVGDSIESSSPEPCFGIKRLQSGTRVDKLMTHPSPTKRLESSSESSLDISNSTTSPGVEEHPKSPEILRSPIFKASSELTGEVKNIEEEKVNPEGEKGKLEVNENRKSGSSSSIEITTLTSTQDPNISKSTTPENVKIELDTSTESPAMETQTSYNIMEITEEEVQALFPKVRKRGRSVDQREKSEDRSDGHSVASFDISHSRKRTFFPKGFKTRRGKSLESGMAAKEAEQQAKTKKPLETQSQKGDDERPPVPPETYLWEELRRWRMKGGYPWTYLDKPPFDEKTWKNNMDHEYEPINPPPLEKSQERANQGEAGPSQEDDSNARRFLRIPRDEELVVDSVSPEDMEVEAIGAARDFQESLEDRFLATPLTTTTASRTDCDVNTSMLDSSGLEDLPLKRDSRTKKALQSKTEQMRAQAQGLQQRIRSQAGKLRNKLRSIPRPTFQRKQQERAHAEVEDKPRFRLPERPKFNLPERPKFKMPPKPKINLPNFTKPLRERQAQAKTSNEPGKKLFDLDFKTYPRMFNKKSKDRGDYTTSSPKLPRSATPPPAPIQPARKKGPVGQRWVNRFDDIKFADDRASELSRRSERSVSESLSGFHDKDFAIADDLENTQLPPPRTLSTKSSISHMSEREFQSSRSSEDRHRKGVIEEIDSDQFFLRQKGISQDDIDMGKYLSEEIREAFKSPVVNALRQLDLDYEDKEVEQYQDKVKFEPLAPTRMRSLKRTPKVNSTEERTVEKEEATTIISSANEQQKTRYENIAANDKKVDKSRYENSGVNEEIEDKSRYENIEEDATSEYYKSPPPPQEYEHYKVPKPSPQPTPTKRKSSSTESKPSKKKTNGWVEVEIETSFEEIPPEAVAPQPLQRKKSKRSLHGPQMSQEAEKENIAPVNVEPNYEVPVEATPDPPKRTRSLSRGAKIEEAYKSPIPPKRTSSKSIHSLGLSNEEAKPNSTSVTSLPIDAAVAPKRVKSFSRGSRSYHSLTSDSTKNKETPQAPERMRSLSRNSHGTRSYHSLADDERSWAPQAPERTRSLSRPSKAKQTPQPTIPQNINHYEAASEDGYAGYAVVEKPKPPRPPPPRHRKGSQSPTFNTFPRRSPIRPVRNYATLGPSRPPRRTKAPLKSAVSLEHIYSSDQMSQSYVSVEGHLQPLHSEDSHGSNKDLQKTDVIEKMKGRPLPAPPRPPRLKTKSEEPNQSFEEVEEVCVSTQTDPLPDDVCLEDDIIQEFSHEQLKLQEQFLEEMREEEERIQREIESKKARKIDVTVEREQNEAKLEIIGQMEDIIREERRLLLNERRTEADENNVQQEDKKTQLLETAEDDMGYASLDRRQIRPEDEPLPSTSFQAPLPLAAVQTVLRTEQSSTSSAPGPSSSVQQTPQTPVCIPLVPEIVNTERLHVGQLEVDRLRVNQLEAVGIVVQNLTTQTLHAQDIQGGTFQIRDITSSTGNLTLGNIELPQDFIRQIVARIPWEELRPLPPAPAQLEQQQQQVSAMTRKPPEEEQQPQVSATTRKAPEEEQQPQGSGSKRKHRTLRQRSKSQISSDEDSAGNRQQSSRRPPRAILAESRLEPSIGELGQQLTRACTTAGLRAMRDFAGRIRPALESEDRTRYVQAVLCVALVIIAGYFLLTINGKDVHHHHWDFQFPPQPPKH